MSKVISLRNSKVTWGEALNQFQPWKQAQGISDTTLQDYKRHVHYFFKRFPDSWEEGV